MPKACQKIDYSVIGQFLPASSRPNPKLQRATGLDSTTERKLVGILQVSTHGKAARQTAHLDAKRLDGACQIARRGLALDIGIGGDNDLVNILGSQARQQLTDMKLLGTCLLYTS